MKNIFAITIILFFFSRFAYSSNNTNNVTWIYSNVSNVDVFGKHDPNMIDNLDRTYKKVVVNIDNGKLIINNYFLEDVLVCSIDYTEIKKTPVSYYLSQKIVDMYHRLFKREGISIPKDIYILTSVFPDHECPAPYSEIIKINDQLIIPEQNYVLFFKKGKTTSEMRGQREKEEAWSTYCHKVNPKQIYDGSSKWSCYFEGLDLKSAYSKLITLGNIELNYLKENLPVVNSSYRIHDKSVSYQWTEKGINVSVFMDGERVIYSFNKLPSGVKLIIMDDTQY